MGADTIFIRKKKVYLEKETPFQIQPLWGGRASSGQSGCSFKSIPTIFSYAKGSYKWYCQ